MSAAQQGTWLVLNNVYCFWNLCALVLECRFKLVKDIEGIVPGPCSILVVGRSLCPCAMLLLVTNTEASVPSLKWKGWP